MKSSYEFFYIPLVIFFVIGIQSMVGCARPPVKIDMVWPQPPEKARIRYIESLSSKEYFGTSLFKSIISGAVGEQSEMRLSKPYGVVTDSLGNVYVSDTGLGAVLVFDKVAKRVRSIGDKGGSGRLSVPTGICIGRHTLFVSDTKAQRVYGYDFQGRFQVAIGAKDEFTSPSGLAYDPSTHRLFVVDAGKHQVRAYEISYDVSVNVALNTSIEYAAPRVTYLFSFGKRGNETGQFNFPTNAVFYRGKLYVVDTMNFRVQIFDADGKFITSFGKAGNRPGFFSRPKGIGISSDELIFVVDAGFDNFQIFNNKGEVFLFVGSVGSKEGYFNLPAGVFIDSNNYIYVVDQLNARIQVFQYLAGG